jgi:hypothetical protein
MIALRSVIDSKREAVLRVESSTWNPSHRVEVPSAPVVPFLPGWIGYSG